MASNPTVTMSLAGDESKLTQAFDRVGQASEQMADKVKSSGREVEQTGDAFDSLGEATDSSESKFQGFADTLTGTQDIMTGFREGDIVGMATGFADLAGGLTEFVVPALSSFAGMLAGPLRTAMSFIAAHPLLIALGVLIGLFVTLWTTSETFRGVVISVFNAVGGFISNVFGGVIRWIVDRWNWLVGFFKGIPNAIGEALAGIGGFFERAFKGAANLAIDAINWMIDQINKLIYGINLINPFDDIPDIPKLRRFHTGGIVPGMPGQEVPILAMAGERVTPTGQAGGGSTLRVIGDVDGGFISYLQMLADTGQLQLGGS